MNGWGTPFSKDFWHRCLRCADDAGLELLHVGEIQLDRGHPTLRADAVWVPDGRRGERGGG